MNKNEIVLPSISGGIGKNYIVLSSKEEYIEKKGNDTIIYLNSSNFYTVSLLKKQFVLIYAFLDNKFPQFKQLSSFQTKTLLGKRKYKLIKKLQPLGIELK